MKKLKNTRKMLVAASALVVAVAVSAGATYAWFTQNSESTISGIDATVKAAGDTNIMVAVGHDVSKITFKTDLDSSDLSDYLTTSLDAVTNTNTTKTDAPSFYKESGNGTYSVSETTATEGTDYIKIPITVRTDEAANVILEDGDDTYVKAGTGGTTSTTVTEWRSSDITAYNATGTYELGSLYTAYAYNAVRVGFTTGSGTVSDNKMPTESDFEVWSPNEAMYGGQEVQADTPSSATVDRSDIKTDDATNYWANNLARDYYSSIYGTTSYDVADYSSNYVAPDSTTDGDNVIATTATGAVSNSTACYQFLYIYIWLEGTDGDCFNNILGQGISVSFSLTAEQVSSGD